VSLHFLKNQDRQYTQLENQKSLPDEKIWYATIKGETDKDYKIERLDDKRFTIADLASGVSTTLDVSNFNVEYGSLIRFNSNGDNKLL
jgi:hypothetical protein